MSYLHVKYARINENDMPKVILHDLLAVNISNLNLPTIGCATIGISRKTKDVGRFEIQGRQPSKRRTTKR
jgi:hypothetical protein